MTFENLDLRDEQFIECEDIRNFCINSNRETRLRCSVDQYDLVKLDNESAQDLIDNLFSEEFE